MTDPAPKPAPKKTLPKKAPKPPCAPSSPVVRKISEVKFKDRLDAPGLSSKKRIGPMEMGNLGIEVTWEEGSTLLRVSRKGYAPFMVPVSSTTFFVLK